MHIQLWTYVVMNDEQANFFTCFLIAGQASAKLTWARYQRLKENQKNPKNLQYEPEFSLFLSFNNNNNIIRL